MHRKPLTTRKTFGNEAGIGAGGGIHGMGFGQLVNSTSHPFIHQRIKALRSLGKMEDRLSSAGDFASKRGHIPLQYPVPEPITRL